MIFISVFILVSIFLIFFTFSLAFYNEPLDVSVRSLLAVFSFFTFITIHASILLLYILASRTIAGILYKCISYLTVISLCMFLIPILIFLFMTTSYIVYRIYFFKFICTLILFIIFIAKLSKNSKLREETERNKKYKDLKRVEWYKNN